jgi:hypothetical protein
MSYEIEYQWRSYRLDESVDPGFADHVRHVIVVQHGPNNLIDYRTNAARRDWSVCCIGTASQVLRQAVRRAAACESGSLKPHGQDCSPESYITRILRLLHKPASAEEAVYRLRMNLRVHGSVLRAELGLPWSGYEQYDSSYATATSSVTVRPAIGVTQWPEFFARLDPLLDTDRVAPHDIGSFFAA